MNTQRHKVFVSYHHANDQYYKNSFEELFSRNYDIMVSKSVQIGEIDPYLKTETIRQKIRDEYLRDTSVTVVLIGTETWKRKHVDWEIAASIRSTLYNSRSGLIGIFLPSHPDFGKDKYKKNIIPPRLYDNANCGFTKLYDWNTNPQIVQGWIHEAFINRNKINPDNSYPSFSKNRTSNEWS
ncbi:TIR domain-containing protein [Tenacibaculum finnmarkense]|uniref:Thoeris protein ThsB TIR-like domain-containing protein n=1 Tax=Tenacibaculum finnmarkense genomovar finnmarkense TaxID=1458503 RepID=A0AAP1RI41_9FLAO|nr:TIR domain-containing protein [Tenacibaculum finnmarkense]MBE7653971.1 hypothetical protein [Tenacibaculum finnmarkense genomovar finnmarkense]MBE7696267.1 hypothetical protein [Tenacibaculum finnmarkense genomovar finnmarkense]MCD8428538.1 TIR domain-containing protein [Tenacibaculum finnmarkense genomovar finnmarkense]MCG8732329.1 TIR domain-containing protein [Tenacibaculum finnmarkense]MCG8753064.1 TIR domain-containing protein [Tenacibaculum finnmarkense]